MGDWEGGLIEGAFKKYKIIDCMKPQGNSRTQGYTKDGDVYFGRQIEISICLRCEHRVKLEEKTVSINDIDRKVAKAALNQEARMRCAWFRKWVSANQEEIKTLIAQEREYVTPWIKGGERRASWLEKNIHRFLYKKEIECPFCVNDPSGINGDYGVKSYGVTFDSFDKFARHINESHGLIRITKKKRGEVIRWMVRFNGDEEYQEELVDNSKVSSIDDLLEIARRSIEKRDS
jgi:hypothetical protein